ncbi:MAG: oligosaccharide flippase family protein [Ancalomicrobiaceae bacterium]|nr:oligosaccharide flippase family protein [Ancalomicrobiaceae bacterium]
MLLRQTLLYLPAQLFGPLLQFIAAVVWTHQMDSVAYGVVTYLIAAQDLAFVFSLGWWSSYMLRFRGELGARLGNRLQGHDLAFVLNGSAIQVIVAFVILGSISVEITPSLAILTALFLVVRGALSHYGEICRAEQAIATYTVGQLSGPLVGSALSFWALSEFGPDPRSVIGAMTVAQGLGLIIVLRRLGVAARPMLPDRALIASAFAYCAPLIAGSLPYWVSMNGVRVVVDNLAGAEALGLLSVGWGLGQRIAAVGASLVTAAAFPLAVKRLEDGETEEALRQVAHNGMLILGFLTPMAVGAYAVSQGLVDLVIAEPFRAVTIVMFPIGAAAGAVRNYSMHGANQAFLLLKRTDLTLILNICDAVLHVVGAVVGLKVGGIAGAAFGCLVGALVGAVICQTVAALHGLPLFPSIIVRIGVASAGMGAAVMLVPWPVGIAGLVGAIATGGLAYAALLAMLFPREVGLVRAVIARYARPAG